MQPIEPQPGGTPPFPTPTPAPAPAEDASAAQPPAFPMPGNATDAAPAPGAPLAAPVPSMAPIAPIPPISATPTIPTIPGPPTGDALGATPPQYSPPQYAPPPTYAGPGGAPAYGVGNYAAPAQPKNSGKAVAALVLGLVGMVTCFLFVPSILAIVFGVLGRKAVKANPQAVTGKAMATAGIALGAVGLAIGGLIMGLGAAGVFDDEEIADLAVGSCVELPDSDIIVTLVTTPCTEPHGGELFHQGELNNDGEFPGSAEVQQMVADLCLPEFEAYLGTTYDESKYDIFLLFPQAKSWKASSTFTCLVYDPSEVDLPANSVKGSGD